MSYHFDKDLPLVEPKYAYPGDPGPSTWEVFGLGQVDPDTAKKAWRVYAIFAMVGVSVLYLAFKKEDKRKRT